MSRVRDNEQQSVSVVAGDIEPTYIYDDADRTEADVRINRPEWGGYSFNVTMNDTGILSIEIKRQGESAPLNSWRLQQIPLAAIERAVLAQARLGRRIIEVNKTGADIEIKRGDIRLAELARAYVETRGQRKQSQILAQRCGFSPSSIPTLLRRARERGFLTGTTQGRSGGELTMLANMILSQSDSVSPSVPSTPH